MKLKYQTVVISYAGGIRNEVARGEATELSDEEYVTIKDALCTAAGQTTYVDMGGVIIPGEFFRNNCVIEIIKITD